MRWRQESGGLIADAPIGAPTEQYLDELFGYVETYLIPLHEDSDWDYMRVEIWFDSGDIVVYPASFSTRERREKAACLVTFADMLERCDELLDTMEAKQTNNDLKARSESFDSIARRELKKWASLVDAAARRSNLQYCRVIVFDANGDSPITACEL